MQTYLHKGLFHGDKSIIYRCIIKSQGLFGLSYLVMRPGAFEPWTKVLFLKYFSSSLKVFKDGDFRQTLLSL